MEAVSVLVWYSWKADAAKIRHARHETTEAKSEIRVACIHYTLASGKRHSCHCSCMFRKSIKEAALFHTCVLEGLVEIAITVAAES